MSADEPLKEKSGKTFDSAYGFSFAIAIGLLLFIAGLVISLILGESTSIGLIFGIPLLVAGMALPLIMMRGQFKQNEVRGACPYCSTALRTLDSTIRLECPACNRVVVVRNMKFYATESLTNRE